MKLAKNRNIQSERKKIINQTPAKGVFCRYKEFMKMPQYSLEKPTIRNASPYIGDEWEQYRRKEIDSKEHWIDPEKKPFKSSFGTATTNTEKNFIKNYVTATPSNPPLTHQFREDKKDTWVYGPFKF